MRDLNLHISPIRLLSVTAWLLTGFVAGPASATDSPVQMYEQMRHAVHNIDYEGRFVYQVGQHLDAMYVVHRMQNGRELERLVALNGDPKQVIRGARAVACLDPQRHKISVVGSGSRLANIPIRDATELASLYEFELGEKVRVAGRTAHELIISPIDDLRFGYRVALDEQTRLPLRSVMLNSDGEILSQTLFVELKTGRHVTPIEHDLSALQLTENPEVMDSPAESAAAPEDNAQWRIGDLPKGFTLAKVLSPKAGIKHYLFTDGLTSVSLYLEPAGAQIFEGFSRISETEVFGTKRYGSQLTVVGKVPAKTLELIADAVQPK